MAKRKSGANGTESQALDMCRHTEPRFNLIDQPWIPVVWKPGAKGFAGRAGPRDLPSEVGLNDTLTYAHEIAEVADQSPLVTAALHRLLIALVHSIFRGPENRREWMQMWRAGSLNSVRIDAYFYEWRDRFWLFHPERPFLQWPGNDLGVPVTSTLLNMAVASTGDATLFDHTLDARKPGFEPAEAGRQLIAFLTFKTGGFVEGVGGDRAQASAQAAPWADGAAFIAYGKDLFETLMLNLSIAGGRREMLSALGSPEWELPRPSPRTPPKQSAYAAVPTSYLEFLTAPCRHMRLCEPDPQGVVSHIRINLGVVFKADGPYDPAKAYRMDKKQGWRPIGLRADRALWRDSAALLRLTSREEIPVCSLVQAASMRERDYLPERFVFGLRAFGTVGSQAKIDLWRAESLPIRLSVLGNPKARILIEDCLTLAEEVGKKLRHSLWALVTRLVAKSKDEVDRKALVEHLDVTAPFWAALETPFKLEVMGVSDSADGEKVRLGWAEVCMRQARRALQGTLAGLAPSGKALRGGADAERALERELLQVRKGHNLIEEEQHAESSAS